MKSAGLKLLPSALVFALALLPLATRADQGAIRNIPAAQLKISKFILLPENYLVGECVVFTNTAPVEATRVLFLYSLIGKDGKILYGETHEAKGHFASGAVIRGGNPTTCQDGSVTSGNGYFHDGGAVVASVAEVDYSDGTSWHAGPDVVAAAFAQPDAGVAITKAFSWEPGDATQECVSFKNGGTRPVRHVHFMLSHVAQDGSDVVTDPLDDYFALQPGASRTMACRGWNGSLTPRVGTAPDGAQPEIKVFGKDARLVAWISQIDYADGTSWHATTPDARAIAAAAVPEKLDYSGATWWPMSSDVAESFVQDGASGIEITKAFAWDETYAAECVNFVSRSAKPVTRVRFSFSHQGLDRAALDDEPLDVRARGGSYANGVAQDRNCRSFDGTVMMPALWSGGSSDGQILFDLQPSTITVRVDEVDYADGTSWHEPAHI